MALTAKRERFCIEISNGKSQRQAYRIAYPKSETWKDSAVDSQASILANNSEILERLRELRKEAESLNLVTKGEILGELKKLGFAAIDPDLIKPSDKIKALEKMAEMLGYFKDIEMETEDMSETEKEVYGDG